MTAETVETVERILVGAVGAPHGLKGEVRIKSYTEDPMGITTFGTLGTDRPGLTLDILSARQHRALLIARLAAIDDRDAAKALNGVRLYAQRTQLVAIEEDDAYYHADLIGLKVHTLEGVEVGTIAAVADYGATDLLDIKTPDGQRQLVPFTRAFVPDVDLARRIVVVDLPQGLLEMQSAFVKP